MSPPIRADTTASRRTRHVSSILIHSRVYAWSPLGNLSNSALPSSTSRETVSPVTKGQDERVRRVRGLARRLVDPPPAPDFPPQDLPAVWTAPLGRLAQLLPQTADPGFDARPAVRTIVVVRVLLRGDAHVAQA
jgi:hypothetical protein